MLRKQTAMMHKKFLTQINKLVLTIGLCASLFLSVPGVLAQTADSSLHEPEVAAWVSGPNLPTTGQGETAQDFNDDRWQDLHAIFVVGVNPFDSSTKQPNERNPEDFYGMIAEKAACDANPELRPTDDRYTIIHEIDLPDRENDPAWADSFEPSSGFIFIDNETDVAPGSCGWYKFSLMNYDGTISPSAYVPINLKTTICNPKWEDSSGKIAAVKNLLIENAQAASFDTADCILFSSMFATTSTKSQTNAVIVVSIGILAGFIILFQRKRIYFSLKHVAIILLVAITSTLFPVVPQAQAQTQPSALVRNPNGGTTRGLYYYRDYTIIANALAKAWPKDPRGQAQALGYMDSHIQGPSGLTTDGVNYFELYTKESKKEWLNWYVNNVSNKAAAKKFQQIVLKAEEDSKWESVRLAEGSIRQTLQGTYQIQAIPQKNLRDLTNKFTVDLVKLCREFGPTAQDAHKNMLRKRNWKAGQLEFFYRFLTPNRYKKYQGEQYWSTKVELPNGSTRYLNNVAEGSENVTQPLFQYTEYYQVTRLATLCDQIAKSYAGVVPQSPLEDLDAAFTVIAGAGLLKEVVKATLVKAAGAEVFQGGKTVGTKVIPKANPGRMSLTVKEQATDEFTRFTFNTSRGSFALPLDKLFNRIYTTSAVRKLLAGQTAEAVTKVLAYEPLEGIVTPQMLRDILPKIQFKSCKTALGRCRINHVETGVNAVREIEVDPYLSLVNQGSVQGTITHELGHAISISNYGSPAKIPGLVEVFGHDIVNEGGTEWFAREISGAMSQNLAYEQPLNLFEALVQAYARRLRKEQRMTAAQALEASKRHFAQGIFKVGVDEAFLEKTFPGYNYITPLIHQIKNGKSKEAALKETINAINKYK